jgi:hypothetical protein
MDFAALQKVLMEAPRRYKTRQEIWHDCIEALKPGSTLMEFGVWRGNSINYFAQARPENELHGFDSFNGLPKDWIKGRPTGHFKTDKATLRFSPNVCIHDGLFSQTLPKALQTHTDAFRRMAVLHIDCDLGSSTTEVLSLLEPILLEKRPLMLFDEFYNYPDYGQHEFQAFLDFIKRTRAPFRILGRNINHQQALIQLGSA